LPAGSPAETVTTAFQLGAIAFMLPVYGGVAVLVGWGSVRLARIRRNAAGGARAGRADGGQNPPAPSVPPG
jgi:hypothetical protein